MQTFSPKNADLFSKECGPALRIHPAFCSVGNGQFFSRESTQDVRLTTDLHLVPELRMSRAIPLLPPSCTNSMDREVNRASPLTTKETLSQNLDHAVNKSIY